MSANYDAIAEARERPGFALGESPPGVLHAVPEWSPIPGPLIPHDRLCALLDGIRESEVEPWVLDCLAQERGKRRKLPHLKAERGGIYGE